MKRDLVSIHDLSDVAITAVLDRATELAVDLHRHGDKLPGVLMGTVFLEPSTRTRLSFEAAMHRLGGRVITSADAKSSSSAKGETLADTIRMVDAYVDVIVLRHAAAGAARLAARLAAAPVINAGDGGREHPSQTLVDLYTLRRERGRLAGLQVVLYGDLRHGRTTHSLTRALCRFGARVIAIAEPGLELPAYVVSSAAALAGARAVTTIVRGLGPRFGPAGVRAVVFDPVGGGLGDDALDLRDGLIDAVYVTRVQKERLAAGAHGERTLPPIDLALLAEPAFRRAVILHPLPRVDEIHRSIDADPRAAYFRQAAAGVPVRMALIEGLMGSWSLPGQAGMPAAVARSGLCCVDPGCLSTQEPQAVPPEVVVGADGRSWCAWCENTVA